MTGVKQLSMTQVGVYNTSQCHPCVISTDAIMRGNRPNSDRRIFPGWSRNVTRTSCDVLS